MKTEKQRIVMLESAVKLLLAVNASRFGNQPLTEEVYNAAEAALPKIARHPLLLEHLQSLKASQ